MTAVHDMPTPARRRVGRPRDPELDEAILQATRELLVEEGYDGITIHAIARRAGLFAPAVHRRWSTKFEVVEAAVFAEDWDPPEPTGDIHHDVRRFVVAVLELFSEPAVRAALPGLIGETQSNASARAALSPRTALFIAALGRILDAAAARGHVPERTIDARDLLPPVLVGTAFILAVLSETPVDAPLVDAITDFLVRGL